MNRPEFIFYRDTYGEGAWHDTLMVLQGAAAAADAAAQSPGRVMLDAYGRPRTVREGGSRADAPAAPVLNAGPDELVSRLICGLVSFATEFSLYGNVWQQWLTYMLMMHENAFTLACERRSISTTSTMMKLALNDLGMFYMLFKSGPDQELLKAFTDYRIPYAEETENATGRQIRMLTGRLKNARSREDFARVIMQYYATFGTGIYGLYRAFRISEEDDMPRIVPVTETADVKFDDLIGYEEQKKTLKENTEAFLKGGFANNVLLYGDSGTGKSTSVHALMHDYFIYGLRLVEVSKADRCRLPQILSEIKKRNYRFIIFLDDLSFEEDESDYKELKAMLEGALETRSDRVLIYATSNRRHLIRETWGDRQDMEYNEDIHHSDTMEEKLSLASRFGITLYYSKPDQKEYLNIVRALAARNGIEMSDAELAAAARKWELRHGGMTGRAASQLVTWLGSEALVRERNQRETKGHTGQGNEQ